MNDESQSSDFAGASPSSALHSSSFILHPSSLPPALTRQFDSLERRLWRLDSLAALTGGVGSLLLSYALQFSSDRLWDTPQWLRLLFALAGWAGFAVFAYGYGDRWIWKRRSIRQLAVIVQRRYQRLGDRLLGIVELADPRARPSNYSAELCTAAITQVAGEASSFDFRQAATQRQPRHQLFGFLALALLVGTVALLVPDAGRNALMRWFLPTSNIDRYTFVSLDALPDHLVVAQGEPFDIVVGLARNSFWRPQSARSHFDGLPSTQAPILNGAATFHFPGQTQERLLWLSAGDVARSLRIRPEVRPDLRQVRVQLDLPAYLQYPRQEQTVDSGRLAFLPGTTAIITGETVRNLGSATLAGPKLAPLAIDGPRFTTAALLLELERDITISWRDSLGLAGPEPLVIHATPVEDMPPQVELAGIQTAVGILPEETVHIDLNSTDDYGVRRLNLSWQIGSASPIEPPGPVHDIKVADGQPQAKTLAGHFDFSPAVFEIAPGATILVRGLAVDYYPDREPSQTPIYRIHVLSRADHARLIHDQFEKILEQLEELTRRQSAILQSGKAVRAQNPKDLAKDESGEKLSQQSGQQEQNAGDLKDLANQTAQTLAEAMRNPDISPATLKSWAAHAGQMHQLATSAMPTAAQSLESAKSDATARPRNLDQALAQEQDILNAMRQMQRQANDDLESLAARTLASRLRSAAAAERDLAGNFQILLPDTIGLTPDQLPDERRDQVKSMSATNAEVSRESGRLQEEISRLYDRTSLPDYGDVAHEMTSYKIEDGLIALGKLVDQNIGVQSIDTARYWGDQFERWANRLGDGDKSRNQPVGQPGQPDPAQMQALMALMRLRQQQDQLREQTSVIEEQKGTTSDYSANAQDAGRQQGALRDQVRAFSQDPTFPIPSSRLAPAGKSMDDATSLLAKPETGTPTYAAQTDAINILDAVIAAQSQQSGQDAGSLMAMMGMGNGNPNGGTSRRPNDPIPGSTDGLAPDQRKVIQAGGIDNSQLPGEFRDAIESYHRAIEQSR